MHVDMYSPLLFMTFVHLSELAVTKENDTEPFLQCCGYCHLFAQKSLDYTTTCHAKLIHLLG